MANLTVSVQGFSVTMSDFTTKYKESLRYMKQTMSTLAERFVGRWATNVMITARYLAPASFQTDDGVVNIRARGKSLANSIVRENVSQSGAIKTTAVGVDSSLWDSNYPLWFKLNYNKNPPWGIHPKNLALFIHEYWDKFTANKPMARERALTKQSMQSGNIMADFRGDSHVGEKFLYRAAVGVSSPRALAVMARAEMNAAFRPYGSPFRIGAYKHTLENPLETKTYEYVRKPKSDDALDY